MSNKFGAIDIEYTVWCSGCGEWVRKKASTRAVFAKQAERAGWWWKPGTKGRPGRSGLSGQPGGWLCKACAEKESK